MKHDAAGPSPVRRRAPWLLGAAALAVLAVAGGAASLAQKAAPATGPVPMAVLGDSNTHSYQDSISFPPGSGLRGGPFHDRTFQWTEVLARLRAGVIDPGPWEVVGQNRVVAQLGAWADVAGARSPRKQDYRYNFASSGAGCGALTAGVHRQVQPLLDTMGQDPARWRQGVVILRIGLVQMADPAFLDALSRNPSAAAEQRVVDQCLQQVGRAVRMIRGAHAQTHIVLVGIFDDSNDPINFERWHSRAALDNIARGLDRYDAGLRDLAAGTTNVSFFDDRAWFRDLWGGRGPDGKPAYRELKIGDRLTVTLALGDAPSHALVGDDHWGLAVNAKWAQAMSRHLASVGLPVRPIDDGEVRRFVEAQLR